MSPISDEVLTAVRAHAHYRDADYERLADLVGADVLEARLRVQLRVYEKLVKHHRLPLRWIRPTFRGMIRSGLFCMGQYAKAKRMAREPERVEHTHWFSTLPSAFDGFRILHLSDFHFDFIPEMPEILAAELNGLSFDLCVLTGDFRGEVFGPYEESLRHLQACRPLLGDKVFAVLGNHDNVEILLSLPEMQITPLFNRGHWLERGGDRILLAGIDDFHMYKTHRFEGMREQIAVSPFTLLLSHTPEACELAAAEGVDWMLAGHTHGGQICLPGGIPLIAHNGEAPRSVVRGAWQVGELRGYTSRGVGVSTVDCRWNCCPEITLHTLRSGAER